jgi:peptidoglycan hydrolase CwlO-like protein
MKKLFLFGLFFGLAVLISGCVAMQDDVSTLQDRVVTTETKLDSLEKNSQQSISTFEGDWNPKVAGLSADILGLRERISSTEGSVSTLGEQIRQETEKAEKFRLATSQELLDFQKGISDRLDLMQRDLELTKKTQAETVGFLEDSRKRMDKIQGEYATVSDRIDQFDTGLVIIQEEMTKKLSIIVEEISKENQSLREQIAALEKNGSAKSTPSKPAKKSAKTKD